jgi:hypothetical protein
VGEVDGEIPIPAGEGIRVIVNGPRSPHSRTRPLSESRRPP